MEDQKVLSESNAGTIKPNEKSHMSDIPLSAGARITVERRGQIVLIGINRPKMFNHIDPEVFGGCSCLHKTRGGIRIAFRHGRFYRRAQS